MTSHSGDLDKQQPQEEHVAGETSDQGAAASEDTYSRVDDQAPRRRMIRFVAIFIATVLILLTGYHFATTGVINQRYLYVVAKHTTWVLDLVGHSAQLEYMNSYAGREAEVRAEIRAWESDAAKEGEKPPDLQAEPATEAESAPLTPWEQYRYRAITVQRNLQKEQERLEELEPVRGELRTDTVREAVEEVRARVDEFRGAVKRDRNGRQALVGPPEVLKALPELEEQLDQMDPKELTAAQASLRLNTALQMLYELQMRQYHFVQQRVVQYAQSQKNMGPKVRFVAERGVQDAIRDAQARIAEINRSEGGAEVHAAELAALRADIEMLEARLDAAKDPEERAELNRAESFMFTVVSECGAIEVMAIFVAALLAFPCPWWKRIVGIIVGLPLLYAVNIGRLACLGYIGAYNREWFDFAHHYLWQAIYIIFVVVIWMLWVELLVKQRKKPASS